MDFIDDDIRAPDQAYNSSLLGDIDISSMIANLMSTSDLTFDEAKRSVLMTLEEKKKELQKLKEDQLIHNSKMKALYDAETHRIANEKVAENKSEKVSAIVAEKKDTLKNLVIRLGRIGNTELVNHLQQFINSEDEYMKLSNPTTLKLFEDKNKILKKDEIAALSNYFEEDRPQEYEYEDDESYGGKRRRIKSIKQRKSKQRKSKKRTNRKKN